MSFSPSDDKDHSSLAAQAFQHIEVLAHNIGARPAGSSSERQALDYISGILSQLGYEIERQPVAFAPQSAFSLPVVIAGLVFALCGWGIASVPWLVIWIPILMMALPQVERAWIQHRKPTCASENLYAYKPGEVNAIPNFILTAHVDSALASPFYYQSILKFYSRTMDYVQRVAWMIAALSLLELFGIPVGHLFIIPVAILGSLSGLMLLLPQVLSALRKRYRHSLASFSSGANDNASGVGVLLALANSLAQQGTSQKAAFLFTSAEETGLQGARAFCDSHENWRHNTSIICLDMVGRGNSLYYVSKERIFRPIYTSQTLNQLLRQANPQLKGIWYTLRSGDFAAFCRAGFPATSLQCGEKDLVDWTCHSIYDTSERIETSALENVLNTLEKIIL